MRTEPVGIFSGFRGRKMTHDKGNAVWSKAGEWSIGNGPKGRRPGIIALDQVKARQIMKPQYQFRHTNRGDKPDADHTETGKKQLSPMPRARRPARMPGKADQEKGRDQNHDKCQARMALGQGCDKQNGKCKIPARLIKASSNRHMMTGTSISASMTVIGMGDHKQIDAGDISDPHQSAKRTAIGKASGPVPDMGGLGKTECCLCVKKRIAKRQHHLKGASNDDGIQNWQQPAIGGLLRDQGYQGDGRAKPDDIKGVIDPGRGIKRNKGNIKRKGLIRPDRGCLCDHPDDHNGGKQPDTDHVAGQGYGVHSPAHGDQPGPGQDGENRNRPRPPPAQHHGGKNDFRHQTKLRQSHHRPVPICFKIKEMTLAQFDRPVVSQTGNPDHKQCGDCHERQ
eukprot:NODE_369_length_2032_cov_1.446719_g362_i0.p2 GENE.NODE_369_length_2032_cov_1.446719_g362_i0~~NODE_369_length_2032_cov_1.446719_g362_i0.p2  ORF type:complete len:395 (+),score=18.48 NODE_369_length_2032_cov_1.446719_g362_i0:459-1643(+)